jgi:chromosomal replication initiation ATPase DnaA
MSTCIINITASCTSIKMDALMRLEHEVRRTLACTDLSFCITPCEEENSSSEARLQRILHACAAAFSVSAEDVASRQRQQNVAFARHAYCHIAHESSYAYNRIAAAIARNHATAICSVRTSKNLLASRHKAYSNAFHAAKEILSE